MVKKVIWDNHAKLSLKKIIKHIRLDSFQNAENVKKKILKSTKEIPKNPERYGIDKYKINNDSNFRAYELFHIRISYFISDKNIRIVRVRSTHQDTLEY